MSVTATNVNYQAQENRDINLRVLALSTVGDVQVQGGFRKATVAATLGTGSVTLTAAQIYGGIILAPTGNTAAVTYTLPITQSTSTVTGLATLYPTLELNDMITFSVINRNTSYAVTMAVAAESTNQTTANATVGDVGVAADTSALFGIQFNVLYNGSGTTSVAGAAYTLYRLA